MLLNEEAAAEYYRNYLQENNIDLMSVFHKINSTSVTDKETEMTRFQFSDFLLYNGLYFRDKEVRLLFSRFDRNENGKIGWHEFLFELKPQEFLYQKYLDFQK